MSVIKAVNSPIHTFSVAPGPAANNFKGRYSPINSNSQNCSQKGCLQSIIDFITNLFRCIFCCNKKTSSDNSQNQSSKSITSQIKQSSEVQNTSKLTPIPSSNISSKPVTETELSPKPASKPFTPTQVPTSALPRSIEPNISIHQPVTQDRVQPSVPEKAKTAVDSSKSKKGIKEIPIPASLKTQVLSFASAEDIAAFAQTSKAHRTAATSETLWKSLNARDFKLDSSKAPHQAEYRKHHATYQKTAHPGEARFKFYLQNPQLDFTKLAKFYAEMGIFAQPDKLITVDIESFNGMYGLDLNAQGVDKWLKDKTKDPVSLSPFVSLDKESIKKRPVIGYFDDQPTTITYREGFQYVINVINAYIQSSYLQRTNPEMARTLAESRIFLYESCEGNPIPSALGSIEHEQVDLAKAAGIPVTNDGLVKYVSWNDVILQVLKDKGIIFDTWKYGSGRAIQF